MRKDATTFEQFVSKARILHGNKYFYFEDGYTCLKGGKINYYCPTHGDVTQGARTHVRKSGCPKCSRGRSVAEAKVALESKGYNFEYDFEGYKNNESHIGFKCDKHGWGKKKYASLLSGVGCSKCRTVANRTPVSLAIQKITALNRPYDYDFNGYVSFNSSKIGVKCKLHGWFKQTCSNLYRGYGCPSCRNENRISPFRYSEWKRAAEKSKKFDSFKVYVVECFNDDERFVKIGKTFNTVAHRFRGTKIPYNHKAIKEIKGECSHICNLEKIMHKKFKDKRYIPSIEFGGMYECFDVSILKDIDNE